VILKDKKTDGSEFHAKPSRKVKPNATAPPDGDTWQEHIVIINKKERKTRSYFKSKLTNKCVWDEPPSGATNIILFGSET
jgi:hypothetical protein